MYKSLLSALFTFSLLYFTSPAYASPFIKQGNNLLVLPSPDKATIKDLPIVAYRGLPLIGTHFLQLEGQSLTRQQYAKMQGNSAFVFSSLMKIKLASAPPNKKRLKENFNGKQQLTINQGMAGDILEDRQWYALITKLAAITLTDKAYAKYMCKTSPCTKNDLKGKNQKFMYWGGFRANQFAARRTFFSFIDDELDNYLAWAKQLDAQPEVYMVGKTQLSLYQFDQGGFAVRLSPVGGSLLPTTGENLRHHPLFTAFIKDTRIPGVLVKVDEHNAEKIVERVRGKQLFYIYKAKLSVAEQSYDLQTKQLIFNRLLFDQTITSDVVEVFVGPELQDKLFDIPVH